MALGIFNKIPLYTPYSILRSFGWVSGLLEILMFRSWNSSEAVVNPQMLFKGTASSCTYVYMGFPIIRTM